MASEFAAAREMIRGAARFGDLVYILSKGKALSAKSIAHSSVIALDGGKWAEADRTAWDASAIAVARAPAEKLVVVGEDGDVLAYVGGISNFEKISPAPVTIRNAHTIDGHVYACGMKRQVYWRSAEGMWKNISAPFPKPKEQVGFEAIDGYAERELYASGWGGEIWEYDGSNWHDRSIHSNLILTAVCCAQDGFVYIGGQKGTLLRGRKDVWEPVDLVDDFGEDIWDLCWFQGKLYVAIMQALLTLEGNNLVPVDFGGTPIQTCYSLSAADGILWSIGRDDAASFDGKVWVKYD